ncbi:hypothetical protein GCM10027589_24170 [Actinocorallia lasiicapitis]
MSDLLFRRYDAAGARAQRDTVRDIHLDAYATTAGTDPFRTSEEFMRRFDRYAGRDGLLLVIAYDGEAAIGQAWGWPLTANSGWWTGLATEPEPGFTTENGHRTFALSELMVRQAWTGSGVAHALHDELLRDRPEQRATLLVRPANPAYAAYERWGWRKATELRPNVTHAPLMDVLIKDL